MACQPLFLHVAEHHFGTRPRDGTGTLVPHHPHSTSCPGSRCAGAGMGFLGVSPCMAGSPPPSSCFIVTTICGAGMHRVCSRSPCSRYPSPRLARRVRDIGVGAGVGQWTQQHGEWGHGLGVGGRRAEGDCRPTRRSPAAMPSSTDWSTSCPRERRHHPHQHPVTPPDAFSVGQRLVHRIGAGSVRRNGRWRGMPTVVSKRLGLCGETCL